MSVMLACNTLRGWGRDEEGSADKVHAPHTNWPGYVTVNLDPPRITSRRSVWLISSRHSTRILINCFGLHGSRHWLSQGMIVCRRPSFDNLWNDWS
jgi:hypothetical protein